MWILRAQRVNRALMPGCFMDAWNRKILIIILGFLEGGGRGGAYYLRDFCAYYQNITVCTFTINSHFYLLDILTDSLSMGEFQNIYF